VPARLETDYCLFYCFALFAEPFLAAAFLPVYIATQRIFCRTAHKRA